MFASSFYRVGFVTAILACGRAEAAEAPLEKVRSMALPNVEGRIDHLAIDLDGHRLFVAALGNNTVEVVDLEQGKRVHTITGLREPQGVAYLARTGRIAVANGEDGSCRFFDGQSYARVATIDCKEDADNIRCDERADRGYVGYGKGGLAVIDLAKSVRVAEIPLSAHPESFQLERSGERIFVNLPGAREIAVVDRAKQAVVAHWPIGEFRANFPMALDETNRRLFVACRQPARFVAFDAGSGKTVASLPCAGDADDIFYDASLRRVYVSGGEGEVSVLQQSDADHYAALTAVPTAAGARTSLFAPSIQRLYVAVPHRGGQPAEILEYRTPGPP